MMALAYSKYEVVSGAIAEDVSGNVRNKSSTLMRNVITRIIGRKLEIFSFMKETGIKRTLYYFLDWKTDYE
jgi:hypothetical protein